MTGWTMDVRFRAELSEHTDLHSCLLDTFNAFFCLSHLLFPLLLLPFACPFMDLHSCADFHTAPYLGSPYLRVLSAAKSRLIVPKAVYFPDIQSINVTGRQVSCHCLHACFVRYVFLYI